MTERQMADLPSALERMPEIAARLEDHPVAAFLDYDGTLSPIVERPGDAALPERVRKAVVALAERCTVAIVSGRDLDDVRSRAEVPGVLYAGSHGFEIEGPSGRTENEEASGYLADLDAAEEELEGALGDLEGVQVERKRYAIAVHFRRANRSEVPAVEEEVSAVGGRHPRLARAAGKMVLELRPDIDWHKGRAVAWLMEALGLADDAVPIFVGDDVTDEDAFREIGGRGIGVVVLGEVDRETAADYSLAGTDEVREFLERLAEMIP